MLGQIPFQQLGEMASHGSPMVLRMFGRALGMGDAEAGALARGQIPTWVWVVVGGAAGVAAGVYVHRTWPSQIDGILKGKKR